MKSKMTMQVHDELVFDMYKKEERLLRNIIKQEMKGNQFKRSSCGGYRRRRKLVKRSLATLSNKKKVQNNKC